MEYQHWNASNIICVYLYHKQKGLMLHHMQIITERKTLAEQVSKLTANGITNATQSSDYNLQNYGTTASHF
eukprot:1331809-Ditylum_brightwellii.AAC.1